MGSYIKENLLTDDEKALFSVNRSWFHIMPRILPIYLGILSIGIAILLQPWIDLTTNQQIISTIVIIGMIGFVTGVASIIHSSEEYVVAPSRVITKEGILDNDIYEISIDNIESIDIDQGIAGRIFNYGTLELNGTGNEDRRIVNIAKPVEFKKAIR